MQHGEASEGDASMMVVGEEAAPTSPASPAAELPHKRSGGAQRLAGGSLQRRLSAPGALEAAAAAACTPPSATHDHGSGLQRHFSAAESAYGAGDCMED